MTFRMELGFRGPRALLTSAWLETDLAAIQRLQPREMVLNASMGWRGCDVDFLRRFSELETLNILSSEVRNIDAIHCLSRLQELVIRSTDKGEIRADAFPMLKECEIIWRSKAKSLLSSRSTSRLLLLRYDGANLEELRGMSALRDLTIIGGSLRSLYGVGELPALEKLSLLDLRKLEILDGIESAIGLKKLEIRSCRKVSSISHLRHLRRLTHVGLNDCGIIDSLEPLRDGPLLESVSFYGTTRIKDRDLRLFRSRPPNFRTKFAKRPGYIY